MTAKLLLHAELDLFPTSSNVIISTEIYCVKMCLHGEMDQAPSILSFSLSDKMLFIQSSEQIFTRNCTLPWRCLWTSFKKRAFKKRSLQVNRKQHSLCSPAPLPSVVLIPYRPSKWWDANNNPQFERIGSYRRGWNGWSGWWVVFSRTELWDTWKEFSSQGWAPMCKAEGLNPMASVTQGMEWWFIYFCYWTCRTFFDVDKKTRD